MKINSKKFTFLTLTTISICLITSLLYFSKQYIGIKKDPNFQKYSSQICNTLDNIHKNKNENKELSLEIQSKKNDLDMSIKPIKAKQITLLENYNTLIKEDENNLNLLKSNINSMKENIEKEMKSKNYERALTDMYMLSSLQKDKNSILQKFDLDLTNILNKLN